MTYEEKKKVCRRELGDATAAAAAAAREHKDQLAQRLVAEATPRQDTFLAGPVRH